MNAFEKITQVLIASFDIDGDDIEPETSIVSLNLDSLERAELILELEEALGVEIPDDDLPKLITLQDIADYAERRHANQRR